MRNIEIGSNKILCADKRGWQLKNIEIGRHSYQLCSKEFLPLSDLSIYIISKAFSEIEKYINFQDKCLFFCIKENYLFIIHHSEEAYAKGCRRKDYAAYDGHFNFARGHDLPLLFKVIQAEQAELGKPIRANKI